MRGDCKKQGFRLSQDFLGCPSFIRWSLQEFSPVIKPDIRAMKHNDVMTLHQSLKIFWQDVMMLGAEVRGKDLAKKKPKRWDWR